MKRKPTGFVAICQCSKIIGALDATRTQPGEAGKILGKWLFDGCTVMPHFTTEWAAGIEPCACTQAKEGKP